jgi:hypothetical protein
MKIPLTVFIIVISQVVNAQKNSGFFGHKFFIQSEFLGNYPFFSNFNISDVSTNYVAVSNTLVQKKDPFNCGFRINAGYAFKRNMSVLLEIGQDYSNVAPSNWISGDDLYNNIQHEMVDLVTNVVIPKIEFGTSNSLFPMGLSHQFGLGVAKTHLKENLLKYGVYVTKYDTELGIGDISGRITSCNPKLVRYSFSGLDSSKIKAGLISSGESGEYITSGGRLITV